MNSDGLLTRVLAGLAEATRVHRVLEIYHAQARDMQPWNEVADSLAKAAAAGRCGLDAPPLHELLALRLPDGFIACGPVPWLFSAYLDVAARRAYPAIVDCQLVMTRPSPSACPAEVLRPALQNPAAGRAHQLVRHGSPGG